MNKIESGKVARFTPEVKQEIFDRDNNKCIFCGSNFLLDPHHVLFGPETKKDEKRNTKYNGVTLCRKCHEIVHGCRAKEGKRQECIDYLDNIYH